MQWIGATRTLGVGAAWSPRGYEVPRDTTPDDLMALPGFARETRPAFEPVLSCMACNRVKILPLLR